MTELERALVALGRELELPAPDLVLPGRAEEFTLPHSAPLPELMEAILANGTISLCTQCAARREITEAMLRPGLRIAGSQLFVTEALEDGTQALVY